MARLKDVSIEQLIVLAENNKTEPDDNTDVVAFISAMRFEPGRKRVSFDFVWILYRMWSETPTNKAKLSQGLAKRFKRSRNRYSVYYSMKRAPKRKPGRSY